MQNLMENAATIRIAANMMIASGNDTLSDGSKLTMELFESWDEDEQRAFVCNFLCERYDSLTAEERMAEVLKMDQVCHRCGARGEDGINLSPDASVGYTKMFCERCALSVLMAPPAEEDQTMQITVRPHPEWGWDARPSAPVRVHGLASRADLNGQTGKLLSFDKPSGRWCLRLDSGSGECVRIKATNFTLNQEFRFRVADDGSTTVRSLREKIRIKMGGSVYMSSQFSLWRALPTLARMEVDYIDERGVPRPKRLRDYSVGAHPDTRILNVLISPIVKTPNGKPEELDPESEYCKARVWPSWMSHREKVQAHAELFGEGEQARYEGPPNHPDVTTVSSFSVPR